MTIDAVNSEAFKPVAERMHFSQAVKANNLVFCSGVIGTGPDGKLPESLEDEFRAAFEGVKEVLKEAGSTLSDVVEMTTYHVDMGKTIRTFSTVRDEYLSPPWCAWSAIGISGLAIAGAHVEIRVVAKLT